LARKKFLRGVDLAVARGETLALLGAAAAAKAFFSRHLIFDASVSRRNSGIEGPKYLDMSERNLASIRQKGGILFQCRALFAIR